MEITHKAKTTKYLNYLKTRANLSQQELIKQDSFDYLSNYIHNPSMITINLNDGIKTETEILAFIRPVFQKYYRIKYGKNWFKKTDKQRFTFCLEYKTHTHIHLLIDDLTQAEYQLLVQLIKIQEIYLKKGIKIKATDFYFKITPEQYETITNPMVITQELNKNKVQKQFGVNLSEQYMKKFEGMTAKEQDIHFDDTYNIQRTLYINENKAQKLLAQTKVKIFNHSMEFLKIVNQKIYQPEKSTIFKQKAHLQDGLKNVYTYLMNVNNGAMVDKPNVPDILWLSVRKYKEWQELVRNATDRAEINHYNGLMRDLAWEIQQLGSDILKINGYDVKVSKRKRKMLDFPVIKTIVEAEILRLNADYQNMLALSDAYLLLKNWFVEQQEMPAVKDIIRRINQTQEAQQILNDADVKNWREQAQSLYIAEKTYTDKNSAVGYIVKTCGNSYSENNFPIFTDTTIFYPKTDKYYISEQQEQTNATNRNKN